MGDRLGASNNANNNLLAVATLFVISSKETTKYHNVKRVFSVLFLYKQKTSYLSKQSGYVSSLIFSGQQNCRFD